MRLVIQFFFLIILIISIYIIIESDLDKLSFILFTLVTNFYLFFSFKKKLSSFHIFMSIFLWLGFWLKFVSSYLFFDLNYFELAETDNSVKHINRTLFVSTIGILGFVISSFLNYIFFPLKLTQSKKNNSFDFLSNLFSNNKILILIFFSFIFVVVAFFNFKYSIYQRGVISDYKSLIILNPIVKWLLLFGFTSFSSILIYHALIKKKKIIISLIIISIFENFLSSISMLSRGMFVNSMAIFVGIYKLNQSIKIKKIYKKFIFLFLLFSIFF